MTTPSFAPRRPAAVSFAALRAGLVCAAIATALAARPADAQWGKIKDLGKAAAKGAVEGSAEGAAKKAVPGPEGAPARASAVKFTENLVEITEERVAAFLRGYDAEIAARPQADKLFQQMLAADEASARTYEGRVAEYERQHKAWEKRDAAYKTCAEPIVAKYEKLSEKDQSAAEATREKMDGEMTDAKQARLEKLAERMEAAQARGDQAAVRAIADSVQREMSGVMAIGRESAAQARATTGRSDAMKAELARCPAAGDEPKHPEAPSRADDAKARKVVDDAVTKASGLTAAQYRLMHERIEMYVQAKGRVGSGRAAYTQVELDALAKNMAELQARPELVKTVYWQPGLR